MKKSSLLFIVECLLISCSLFIFACKPDDPEADPKKENPADTITVADLDDFSDLLQFLSATKKPGKSPAAPSGSSLKFSIKDTLYLMDEIKRPIKFLHEDTTKNVGGIYLQAQGMGAGASLATYFYDVPEIPEMADNDSVSVVLVGIDWDGLIGFFGVPPAGLGKPFVIDVTITPYGENGQPLAQTTIPVKIDDQTINPNSGKCGLVLPPGDYWGWDLTLTEDPNGTGLAFYNDPKKIWGAGGQDINGCCIDGVSSYDINCASNKDAFKTLRFPTFFTFPEESIKFFDDGTFAKYTKAWYVNPAPDLSNFCINLPGVVYGTRHNVTSWGGWVINQLPTPYNGDSLQLRLTTYTSVGGPTRGTNGGIIHQLDCNTLVLVNPDNEIRTQYSVTYFYHAGPDYIWYPII